MEMRKEDKIDKKISDSPRVKEILEEDREVLDCKLENLPRYLLLLEAPSCHDMDEWMGIYFDDENLKQAYYELADQLEERKKVDRYYRSLELAIWRFQPRKDDQGYPSNNGEFIYAKQDISPVELEELHCFKEISV